MTREVSSQHCKSHDGKLISILSDIRTIHMRPRLLFMQDIVNSNVTASLAYTTYRPVRKLFRAKAHIGSGGPKKNEAFKHGDLH